MCCVDCKVYKHLSLDFADLVIPIYKTFYKKTSNIEMHLTVLNKVIWIIENKVLLSAMHLVGYLPSKP